MIEKVNQVQEAAGSCYSVLGANVPPPLFFFWDYSQSVSSQDGTTLTAQTQSGLLPPLWLAGAKYLVRCAAQRCTDANKVKGTIRTLRRERKKKPATILRWKAQTLEGRNRVFLLICVSFRSERTNQRKTPRVHLHLWIQKLKNEKCQGPILQKSPSEESGVRARCSSSQGRICRFQRNVFTSTWWNWSEQTLHSLKQLTATSAGYCEWNKHTSQLLPGGKCGFCCFVLFFYEWVNCPFKNCLVSTQAYYVKCEKKCCTHMTEVGLSVWVHACQKRKIY